MTKQLTRREDGAFDLVPTTFEQALQFAELMANSDMVPKDYRGKPANVLVAVQMGTDVGLSPMQALQNINVIGGRASLWGDAMLAIVKTHRDCQGIDEVYERDAGMARCVVRRRGHATIERTFSIEDAKVAGLWGKQGPWTQYPKRMLQMRARSFALRDAFPDALRGLKCAEEVQDYAIDATTGETVEVPSNYIEADTVETLEQSVTPAPTLADVLDAIEAADTNEELTEAGRLIRRLDADERPKAIEAGAAKRAELEAFAKAMALSTKQAAAHSQDASHGATPIDAQNVDSDTSVTDVE